MRNGLCPKCGSEEVYLADANPPGLLTGDGHPLLRIYKDKGFWPDVVIAEMNVYVCRACGFLEMYARDIDKLSKLIDCTNWHRVRRNA
jgi:predicted nucleic-acid-binding Zn-ribbon protein